MRLCAVIPAAGRGSRLGSIGPKILTPIGDGRTIWSILHQKISPHVDRVHLVLSPEGKAAFTALHAAAADPFVTCSVQAAPLGMGDAIFGAIEAWRPASAILVVWGDQVLVSADTLRRAIAAWDGRPKVAVIPVAEVGSPYVEYVFGPGGRLDAVRQTREGDACAANGLSDVGVFLMSVEGLEPAWRRYLAAASRGASTGEVNFLPFLPFLSLSGWEVAPVRVPDSTEARGVNTPEDLANVMEVQQPAISKLIRRPDVKVSTLRDLIAAMGGELHNTATFPARSVEIGNFTASRI